MATPPDPTAGAGRVAVRWAACATEVQGAMGVREEVFCGEQGVPRSEEIDPLDEQALHLVALEPDEGEVIGTLRLLLLGSEAKIGRVAVQRDWRRRGIASRMLGLAIAEARERGCVRARLASQVAATALYEAAGFSVRSTQFEEAGIPHVWMDRPLDPAD